MGKIFVDFLAQISFTTSEREEDHYQENPWNDCIWCGSSQPVTQKANFGSFTTKY